MHSESLERVAEEYAKYKNAHTLLHLDHIPVIDEDSQRADDCAYIEHAIRAGFQSVMIDGSRLLLEENSKLKNEIAFL